jgi:aspartyl-tRNA(Asn)/glutamyl-tRNA(Gln) amidotransferase subunit A
MLAIHELSAAAASAAFQRGELSPLELTEQLLERIAACEPKVNAMYRVDAAGAREQARAAEARWRAGRSLSPLDGVPITIKDNIATRGDPSPIGTRANEGAPPEKADAPPAARVREAGCVLLGKTTMPDYGMLSSGVSSLHGITRNPWRLDRNPSGSSAGAAAAAVAGYAPLHLGTDIGGSIRLPATHCGIFGLKPSLGRVPIYPPYMGRVVGPMTRSVLDAALLMSVIARPDPRDFMALPYEQLDFASGLREFEPRGLTIGLLHSMGVGLPVHREVAAACDEAARALERAGARVEPLASFLTDEMLEGICIFFEVRSYNEIAQLPAAKRDKVLPFITEWCTWRATRLSARDLMQAYGNVMAMREAAVAASQPYDFVLAPASPILPYEAELAAPGNDPRNALPHIAFTVPFNMSEQPAASIHWRMSSDALPIGVQVIGRRFDDQGVLKVCAALERLRGPQPPWPKVV